MIKQHPLISTAKVLRVNQTKAEKRLWMYLRNRQLNDAKFKRQVVVGNYIVDFICIEKKLAIELDGSQHMERKAYDKNRDYWLNEQGIYVLRFWNNEVFLNLKAVLETIRKHLQIKPPSPQPSPASGRGGNVLVDTYGQNLE